MVPPFKPPSLLWCSLKNSKLYYVFCMCGYNDETLNINKSGTPGEIEFLSDKNSRILSDKIFFYSKYLCSFNKLQFM